MESKETSKDLPNVCPQAPRTYVSYLNLPTLLNIQDGFGDSERSADETLFIIIHQVFELWFKLILTEVKQCRDKLLESNVAETAIPFVQQHLARVVQILNLMTTQWKVMETLTPQDFLAFRSELGTASGFQSIQLREIETSLGLKMEQRAKCGHANPLNILREMCSVAGADTPENQSFVAKRLDALNDIPTFLDAVNEWAYRTPIDGCSDLTDLTVVDRFLNEYLGALESEAMKHVAVVTANQGEDRGIATKEKYMSNIESTRSFMFATDVDEIIRNKTKRIRAGFLFISSYSDELPLLSWPRMLLDSVIEIEEGFILFRTHHARMVERMIGRRVGSGGSSGVAYLDSTTQYRIFTDLWSVRSCLLPKQFLPLLRNASFYDYKSEKK